MTLPGDAIVRDREMSITHGDLFRLLPLAIENRPYKATAGRIEVDMGEGSVEIEFSEERQRRIASLILPVTHLQFRFHGLPSETVSLFMERFDRSFQRGGG